MRIRRFVPIAALFGLTGFAAGDASGPRYVADKLAFPENYREWVYLSSGFDMSYRQLNMPGHHMFDNVFVEPAAYKAFLASGTWPDKTQLALETRGAQSKGSINQSGNYQGNDLMGIEVHVKDSKFQGGWAFFAFGNSTSPAAMLPTAADCYACHLKHGAVDTTFVQFYPTLLPLAKDKGTLSASYKP